MVGTLAYPNERYFTNRWSFTYPNAKQYISPFFSISNQNTKQKTVSNHTGNQILIVELEVRKHKIT